MEVRQNVGKPHVESNIAPNHMESQNSGCSPGQDSDELMKIIKMSDYKIMDQLLQTPSKISVLYLLLNSPAHRESLMRVLDQAYVEHDVTIDEFTGVVGNITACNNLGFCDDDLPEEGRNHNLALHISVEFKGGSLSNVLIDNGSSLNIMPKSTLSKLAYQGTPMRYSG